MKKLAIAIILALCFSTVAAVAGYGDEDGGDSEDVLVVRYACLVGGRETGSTPIASGVLGREELSEFLLAWEPESDNREVREVFALNEIGELVRQATQLPLSGGLVSGAFAHGDATFEVDLNIRPSRTIDSGEDVMTIMAEIKRNGEPISAPLIHGRLGERSIITTGGKPDGAFLFLVVEIDRLSAEELQRRGLRHSWRKDYMLVDGEDVTAPRAIEKSQPVYPEEARKIKYQGRVVLRTVISAEGLIEDVEVIEGQPHGLSEAAVEAVRRWRFEPALHEGEPVPVFYLLTINFRLE
jgi:TonB family protein